ncbi:hypothetical protein LTR17_018762 [Elasticomyces elasticus]|nr:hypothetical protein LTR17_018762 [Elasticomyces elasticus]
MVEDGLSMATFDFRVADDPATAKMSPFRPRKIDSSFATSPTNLKTTTPPPWVSISTTTTACAEEREPLPPSPRQALPVFGKTYGVEVQYYDSQAPGIQPPQQIVGVTANKHNKELSGDKIRAVVGPVTDDNRLYEVPKMTICALRFTATARARIEKAGGECITFDQLAMRAPTGANVILLRGPKNAREAVKHFGFGPHTDKARWTTYMKDRPNTNAHNRSQGSRARAGSSSALVVADGRVVSRCKKLHKETWNTRMKSKTLWLLLLQTGNDMLRTMHGAVAGCYAITAWRALGVASRVLKIAQ